MAAIKKIELCDDLQFVLDNQNEYVFAREEQRVAEKKQEQQELDALAAMLKQNGVEEPEKDRGYQKAELACMKAEAKRAKERVKDQQELLTLAKQLEVANSAMNEGVEQ